jgi:hypothetical protein
MLNRQLAIAMFLLFASCATAQAGDKPDDTCAEEEICAAWESTANSKAFARCGTNYDCKCEKTAKECKPGLLGGKKYWFNCDCKRKPRCDAKVCAVYETTARGKADLECERTGCKCEKTAEKCDTSMTGKDKFKFNCVCQ